MRAFDRRSDRDLLADAAGDGRAFGAFYRRHEQSVLRFFLHWTRSAPASADLTAETFARVFEGLARYQPERGEPRAWVFGIARHVLAGSVAQGRVENECRRRLGMPVMLVNDAALERIEALDGPASDLLDELSPLLRDAVVGRVVDERDYRELASALACSESVVRQRVRRGLAWMRDRMEVPS